MISDSMQQQYTREGYTIAPEFFTADEVAILRAELERMAAEGKNHNVATDGDGKTSSKQSENLQFIPLSPQSEVYRSLPFAKKVREAVTALIGDAFSLQLDQIFLKPAHHGAGTGWHQDNAYFGIDDPQQGVGMWVALHDATVANGTMHIIPSSHTKTYKHERDMGSDHHICLTPDADDEVLPVEIKAGGALFFNYGIAHCTLGNTTDKPRAGLALHFIRNDIKDEAGKGSGNRPVLSGDGYTRGEAEWGSVIEGQWEARLASGSLT